jgi:hypothetical protein
MLTPNLGEVRALEWRAAGKHLIHDATKRIKVRFTCDFMVRANLFGRHIGIGTNRYSLGGDVGIVRIASNAEITQDQTPVVAKEKIACLEIAMDDAMVVSVLQS